MTDRVLEHLPRIDMVSTGRVMRIPPWYSDAVGDSFDVRSFVIHHPDGPIVIDAGIGSGSDLIDQLYAPQTATAPETSRRPNRCRTATTGRDHSDGRHSTGCGPSHQRRCTSAMTTSRCRSSDQRGASARSGRDGGRFLYWEQPRRRLRPFGLIGWQMMVIHMILILNA